MSFADELKALALTAPKERDTEDVFNEESAAKVTQCSTTYDSLSCHAKPTLLNESKYEGRTVSRKEMMLEDEEFPDEQFELDPDLYDLGGEDDESGTDNNADSVEAESDDQNELDEEDEEDVIDEETESDGDSEDIADNVDISQFMNNSKVNTLGSKADYENDKFKHLEESVMKKFSPAGEVSEDIRKGRSIGHQLKIWDKFLEYRIQFQRVLVLSNQLPPCEIFGDVMKEFLAEPENKRLYQQSVKNIEKAFNQLIAIRQQIVEMYPEVQKSLENRKSDTIDSNDEIASDDEEIPSDIASGYSESDEENGTRTSRAQKSLSGKRRREDDEVAERFNDDGDQMEEMEIDSNKKMRTNNVAYLETGEFHQKLLNFRNATIEKWHQRTKLGLGVKGSKAGYTALEQPPLKQIEHILDDQDRLLRRTRIKRSQYRIVGLAESKQTEKDSEGLGKETHMEIFDDDDFYHHLLREVIERKTQDVLDPFEISRHWIEIQKLRSKIKRRVDTKASKGRRIRYDVIPKLVSFMTPHDATTFSEQARSDLFSSIFGKRCVSQETESRPTVTKGDMAGFKLFS